MDGEPCLLAPSLITLSFHSKVPMMRREKKAVCAPPLRGKNKRKKVRRKEKKMNIWDEYHTQFIYSIISSLFSQPLILPLLPLLLWFKFPFSSLEDMTTIHSRIHLRDWRILVRYYRSTIILFILFPAFEIGTIKAETEMELIRARLMIDKLLVDHPCLPYEYSSDWRFLDCESIPFPSLIFLSLRCV